MKLKKLRIKKYKIDMTIKSPKTIFDIIKNNSTGNYNILKKSKVYTHNCGECDYVYLGEMGC